MLRRRQPPDAPARDDDPRADAPAAAQGGGSMGPTDPPTPPSGPWSGFRVVSVLAAGVFALAIGGTVLSAGLDGDDSDVGRPSIEDEAPSDGAPDPAPGGPDGAPDDERPAPDSGPGGSDGAPDPGPGGSDGAPDDERPAPPSDGGPGSGPGGSDGAPDGDRPAETPTPPGTGARPDGGGGGGGGGRAEFFSGSVEAGSEVVVLELRVGRTTSSLRQTWDAGTCSGALTPVGRDGATAFYEFTTSEGPCAPTAVSVHRISRDAVEIRLDTEAGPARGRLEVATSQ